MNRKKNLRPIENQFCVVTAVKKKEKRTEIELRNDFFSPHLTLQGFHMCVFAAGLIKAALDVSETLRQRIRFIQPPSFRNIHDYASRQNISCVCVCV